MVFIPETNFCDPVYEDCPIDDPTGNSYEDFVKYKTYNASPKQILIANSSIVYETLLVIIHLAYTEYVVHRTPNYQKLLTDFNAMTGGQTIWG